ncbi:MAG: DNA mismatch repair endonuclease MutL [Cyanobacteria bacterium HKST-UBA02]|nr:DNA mismatch repair endonuclease MutL [Cyanobacteria bacterium HKST-UBA02]
MPRITILPDHVASQIAAGEVVERPSSVVKELVENSIDSGASRIQIDISKDCRDIRVADNGCGMTPDDAALAFQRHATSKLTAAADLESLSTLGFRGEALPSIASISHFTCLTRAREAATGTRVEAEDGKVTVTETGCAPGTVMEVKDLFYNVPARLKFLKKGNTEFAHIQEIVQSLAVSYPAVAFELKLDGRPRFATAGQGDLQSTIKEARLFSGDESLCEVNLETENLVISGYLARPTHFRGDRKAIMSIVNGRPVRCPLTFKALDYAYSDLIPRGRYPMAVIKIDLDPSHVDVNIHPTKKEIKYDNGNEIYTALHRAISQSLTQPRRDLMESIRAARENVLESQAETADSYPAAVFAELRPRTVGANANSDSMPTTMVRSQESRYSTSEDSSDQLSFRDSLSYAPGRKEIINTVSLAETSTLSGITTESEVRLPAGWRLAGYLHNTYFIFETDEGIEIIEQHIAHERFLYEKLLAGQETRGRTSSDSQRLCIAVPLTLSSEQIETLREGMEGLRSLGFDFEIEETDGRTQASCIQVPLEMAHQNYALIIQKMIDDIGDSDSAAVPLDATKSIACQAAVKNGMTLSEADILKLVSAWLGTPRHDTCPHGRPVRLKFTRQKLFDLFHPA